jgi:hypothetical protein
VVGTVVAPGGEDRQEIEDQPHAKQISHAPKPTMWRANEERAPMPITSDAERPLPDARRNVARRAEG